MTTKPLRIIEDDLAATGLPYSLEQGGRHLKIKLAGRLVGVMPRDGGHDNDRAAKNVRASIRRAARELGAQP